MKLAALLLLSISTFAADCPKRPLIGSYIYEIVVADPGPNRRGAVNYDRQVIIISPDLPKDLQHETLIHEIMHVAAYESLQRTADYFKRHKYKDDQFIEATAPILTVTLRRYPELLTCDLPAASK